MNGQAEAAPIPSAAVRRGASHRNAKPRAAVLDAEASSVLAQRLASEIASLGSTEAAIEWARQSLGPKNTLTAGDAGSVEATFRERMQLLQSEACSSNPPLSSREASTPAENAARLGSTSPDNHLPSGPPTRELQKGGHRATTSGERDAESVDKSSLALMEPRRYRNKDHVRFVATQPCTVCGRQPSDPHHIRFAQKRALGRKVSDEFTVPLCRIHHRELHRQGDEAAWWISVNIDPMAIALRLWQRSRGVLPDTPALVATG